jgi:hypothetical protein
MTSLGGFFLRGLHVSLTRLNTLAFGRNACRTLSATLLDDRACAVHHQMAMATAQASGATTRPR